MPTTRSPRTYGVWQEKSRYGRKYMGIVRTTYLIDPDGKVAKRWDNVKVDGHAEEVLQAVKSLGPGFGSEVRRPEFPEPSNSFIA